MAAVVLNLYKLVTLSVPENAEIQLRQYTETQWIFQQTLKTKFKETFCMPCTKLMHSSTGLPQTAVGNKVNDMLLIFCTHRAMNYRLSYRTMRLNMFEPF